MDVISSILHILTIFAQCFMFYKPSHDLFDESIAISQAIFESEWYLCQVEIQAALLIVIMRCHKPLYMSIGPFYRIRVFLLGKVCVS